MQSREYWVERALNELLMAEKSVLDYEKSLKQAYDIAISEIKKDIDAFYNRYAVQNKITYAEARRRLNTTEYKEFQTLIGKWSKDAESQGLSSVYQQFLTALSKRKYITRLESLEADIRYQIELLETKKLQDLDDLLYLNYENLFYSNQFINAQGSGVTIKFDTIDNLGIEKAVKTKWSPYNYSQTVWADRDRLVKTLETIIPQSFSRGLNSNKLGDMISKELNVSQNRGRTLARTEVNRIANQASLDSYKIAGIEYYEYLATLDERTSDICRSMDGSVFEVKEAQIGINYPPLHPNCRSTTIAKLEDDNTEEGVRAARDAEGKTIMVPRKMTQEEYINKYIPEPQRSKLLGFRERYYKSTKKTL